MRGRHVPPMPATAVGKAMGAAAVFGTLPPLLILHGEADSVVAPSNAGSSAEVWAVATGGRPGAVRVLQRGKRQLDAGHRLRARRSGRCDAVRDRRAGPCLERAAPPACASPTRPGLMPSKLVWAFAARQFRRTMASPYVDLPWKRPDAHHCLRRQPGRALHARAAPDAVRDRARPHARSMGGRSGAAGLLPAPKSRKPSGCGWPRRWEAPASVRRSSSGTTPPSPSAPRTQATAPR